MYVQSQTATTNCDQSLRLYHFFMIERLAVMLIFQSILWCLNLIGMAFGHNELWQCLATNSLSMTSQILCPLATTNCDQSLRLHHFFMIKGLAVMLIFQSILWCLNLVGIMPFSIHSLALLQTTSVLDLSSKYRIFLVSIYKCS